MNTISVPYWIDPITDPRWSEFIDRHPASSVFHTVEWLQALQKTYGYTPKAITASPPGVPLYSGIPFCFIKSLLTGRRLSSLPFSDHCQPLVDPGDTDSLLAALKEDRDEKNYKYVELRPLDDFKPDGFGVSQKFLFHVLDLSPPIDDIFRKLHNNCIRRKIRRARREGLTTEAGTSERLIDEFFTLQLHTRRKHGLPPQPKYWFRNLLSEMKGRATIRVARSRERAVASILTLKHKKTAIYKYGCSEVEDSNLGGMQLILWQAVEDAKAAGMEVLDLGRCDLDNEGLAIFKERWGAEKREIEYLKHPAFTQNTGNRLDIASRVFSRLPYPVLRYLGRILYRHFA